MYPSDLSDEEWNLICHHFEPNERRGSGHKHPKKLIVDAILYVIKGGFLGALCRMIFPAGKRCTILFENGTNRVYGRPHWTN